MSNEIAESSNVSQYQMAFDTQHGYVSISFTGDITLDLMNSCFGALLQHSKFSNNMNACYDYTDRLIEIDMVDIEKHAQFVARHLDQRGTTYKVAMIANETLNNALLAVYKLLISKTDVEAEVFTSKTQATEWLKIRD